jgi:valyl-tRNA synthetase
LAKNKATKPATDDESKKKEEKKDDFVADTTPKGEKKDCTKPMLDSYHPKSVEAAWYDWWEKKGFFSAKANPVINKKKTPYTMVIPPPNVTGALHLGHALMLSIEDCLIRQKRMKGFETLWLPGCDHAGIATQSVVEKKIMKDEGKLKQDYGREKFVEKVWQWKDEYGGKINN